MPTVFPEYDYKLTIGQGNYYQLTRTADNVKLIILHTAKSLEGLAFLHFVCVCVCVFFFFFFFFRNFKRNPDIICSTEIDV